jgi:hypothetical protein
MLAVYESSPSSSSATAATMHTAGEMYSIVRGWFSFDNEEAHRIYNIPIQLKANKHI